MGRQARIAGSGVHQKPDLHAGDLLRSVVEPRKALDDCTISLGIRPNDAYTLDSRAYVYWQLDNLDAARLDLEHARRLNGYIKPWQIRFKEFAAGPK